MIAKSGGHTWPGGNQGGCHSWRLPLLETATPGGCHSWRLPLLEAATPGGCHSWRLPLLEAATPGAASHWRMWQERLREIPLYPARRGLLLPSPGREEDHVAGLPPDGYGQLRGGPQPSSNRVIISSMLSFLGPAKGQRGFIRHPLLSKATGLARSILQISE